MFGFIRKIKKQVCKPDSVFLKISKILIIYLRHTLLHVFSCLPSGMRASNPTQPVYMALHRLEFTWFHYSITCTFFLLHWS